MSGWVPMEADGAEGWEAAAVWLQELSSGHPWPMALVVADLRWHQRQCLAPGSRAEMPGYRSFATRWSWGPKKARNLLKDESLWCDPAKVEAWQEYRGRTQGSLGAQQGRSRGAPAMASTDAIAEQGRGRGAPRAHLGRSRGDTRRDLDQQEQEQEQEQHTEQARTTATDTPAPPSPAPDPLPLALQVVAPPEEPEPDPIVGALARKLRVPVKAIAPIVRAMSAIRGRDVKLQRCATDAEHVVKLQRATMTPWDELADEIVLVARWARESDDPLAARHIRAEGWADGSDRSRSVDTLCRHGAWGDRLEAATAWAEAQRPRPAPEVVEAEPEESWLDEWERLGRPQIRAPVAGNGGEGKFRATMNRRRATRAGQQPTAER